MSLKAIETRYRGHRFRSRTEARWAVAFDAANIEYEYEKEGFELSTGRYLPDFWLPGRSEWGEIKGLEITSEEFARGYDLSRAAKAPVFMAAGPPDPEKIEVYVLLPSGAMATAARLQIPPTALLAGRGARFEFGESGA